MSSVNKNLILPDGHKARWYLSIPEETVIFSRTVNMATITYPVTSITYDGAGTGVIGDVLPDEEIIIFDQATAVEKGRLRVRGTGHTGTVLNVGEFSAGQLQLADNDTFAVLRSWRIRPRLPEASDTFDPDLITYTDQHSDPPPVCNSGGHYANWLSMATAVPWTGSTSIVVDPDSAGTINHSWDFPSATPSTSSSADPTVDYSGASADTYWVAHEAEDASNTEITNQYSAVVLHDDDNPPIDVLSVQWNSTPGESSRVTITVATEADFSSVPDGSLMMLWVDEAFGATTASYGNDIPGRSHMKFVGYFIRDSLQQSYNNFTATFEAVSARGILEQLPGFSTVLTNDSTPTSWLEAKTLNLKQGIVYRLRELTTALTSTDLILPTGLPEYSELFIQQLTPFGQIQELADAVDCLFACSRSGILQVAKPLYYESSANRTAATTVLTLDTNDILDITTDHPQRYGFNLVEGRGFTSGTGGNVAAFSRAPGNAPSEAPQQTIVERLIFANQTELNQRTGWRYARLNATDYGLPTNRFSITLRGNYDVFDAAYVNQWVNVDTIRCTIESVSLSVDSANFSEATITLDLAEETDGVPGVTYYPPIGETAFIDTPPIDVLPLPPPTLPVPNLPPGYQLAPTSAWLMGYNDPFKVYYALEFDPIAHTMNWIENVYSGMTGVGQWGTSDPFKYSRKYCLTDDGLFVTENINSPTGTFTQVATNLQMFGDASRVGQYIIMSINRQGWMMIMSGTTGYAVTANYGATWYQGAIDGGTPSWNTVSTLPVGTRGNIAISPRSNNTTGILLATKVSTGVVEVWRNNGYGLSGTSWSNVGDIYTGTFPNGGTLQIPFRRDNGAPNLTDTSMQVYGIACAVNGSQSYLYRSADTGATWSQLQRLDAFGVAGDEAPNVIYRALNYNDNYIYAVNRRRNTNPDNTLWRLDRLTQTATAMNASLSNDWGSQWLNINGWPYEDDWLIVFAVDGGALATQGVVAYSDDGGVSIYDVTPAGLAADSYNVAYAEFDLATIQ